MKEFNFPFSGLLFDEEEHRYYYEGRTLKSVTQLLKETLFKDKYGDVDQSTLEKAAKFGTTVHRLLEIDGLIAPSDLEDIYCKVHGLTHNDVMGSEEEKNRCLNVADVYAKSIELLGCATPLAKEYLVTDGRLAGSVDCIAKVNDEYAIVDYKFTYSADVEYLSWQESIYAYLFYKMTGQRISKAYALWVPKRDVELGWFREIPMKTDKEIEALIIGDITSKSESYPAEIREAQMALARVLIEEKEVAERKKMLQATLHRFMEDNCVKQIKSDYYTISYVAATTRKSFDQKKLAEEHPEINIEDYQKISNVKSTVKITIK